MRVFERTEAEGRGGRIRRPGIFAAYNRAGLLLVLAGTLAGCASAGARMHRSPAETLHAQLAGSGHSLGLAGIIDMQHSRTPPKCKEPWDCHDWYGNARLFFFDSRVFALSGPRLVEAAWDGTRLTPLRSVDLP